MNDCDHAEARRCAVGQEARRPAVRLPPSVVALAIAFGFDEAPVMAALAAEERCQDTRHGCLFVACFSGDACARDVEASFAGRLSRTVTDATLAIGLLEPSFGGRA